MKYLSGWEYERKKNEERKKQKVKRKKKEKGKETLWSKKYLLIKNVNNTAEVVYQRVILLE